MLGRALLWRMFDEVQHFCVPDSIFRRVNNAYQYLGEMCKLPEGKNPVEKVPLIVTGSYAEVHIDVFLEDYGMEDDGNLTVGVGDCILRPRRVDSKQFINMNTLLVILRQDVSYIWSEFARIHERHEQLLTVFNRNINYVMRNPVHRI